jgi:hypothetical protein
MSLAPKIPIRSGFIKARSQFLNLFDEMRLIRVNFDDLIQSQFTCINHFQKLLMVFGVNLRDMPAQLRARGGVIKIHDANMNFIHREMLEVINKVCIDWLIRSCHTSIDYRISARESTSRITKRRVTTTAENMHRSIA